MSSKIQPVENVDSQMTEHIVGPTTKTITNDRNQQLFARYWQPDHRQPVRALAFVCHGFGEHLHWYEDLALRLSAIGILAFGHDHVGHGKSDGVRGHTFLFDDYVNDVLKHCDAFKQNHKHLPIFIVGHSMGGMIAIRSAMKKPDFFSGVVLMGPLVRPDPTEATPFKICIAKVLAKILPYISIGSLDENLVTRDKDMVKKMADDPLRYRGGIRAHWAMATHQEIQLMGEHLEDIQWPFLVLHGERDRLCDPDASRDFYNKSRSTDKQIKIFPNAFHHLYLELPEVRQEALHDTVEWLKERLPEA